MVSFIDYHRDVYGIEPICCVLPIAPPTDHAHAVRRLDPSPASPRVRHDAKLRHTVGPVFDENLRIYGVRKVWRQINFEGIPVARCTVAGLMKQIGLQGVVRGRPIRTTLSDKATPCPRDLVNRQFRAPDPNRLWVSDSPTWRPGRVSSTPPS